MSKTYTPEEVAKAVLKKCQELSEEHKLKKAEEIDKCGDMNKEKSPIDKCGDMNKEKSPMEKSNHLKNFMEKKKKKADLKKIGGGTQTTGAGGAPLPGSTATTGGTSIASQIGFGKGEKEKEKGVHQAHYMASKKTGTSDIGARLSGGKPSKELKEYAVKEHKKVLSEQRAMPKPNLPKSEEGLATANKAVGLKPITSDKIKAPPADQMPEKPKAATTLKSYMAKRKK